ncbi:hypothetical protein ACFLS0_02225 [Candidatus Bipolaricaulota bacterium]
MKAKQRKRALWISIAGMFVVGAAVVSFLGLAGSEQTTFTATAYSDVIRFAADGVGSIQIRIYDMSENELWDSDQVSTDFVDWDRTNEWGERLANGYYIYFVQAWSPADEIILAKTGKVVLLPGDQVQLQSAPSLSRPENTSSEEESRVFPTLGPLAVDPANDHTGEGGWAFDEVGIGTSSPIAPWAGTALHVANAAGNASIFVDAPASNAAIFGMGADGVAKWHFERGSDGSYRVVESGIAYRFVIRPGGNVGIGTTYPAAKLEIESSSGQDLIAAYPSSARVAGSAVFVVKSTGEVRADGAFYSGTGGFESGGADVAERINTSEWVEAGDVVEIDPEHVGFFRKATGPYSKRVAGIISTSPGVILGNNIDPQADEWNDNRPILAIAGRVPCKVSAENGSIQIGDLLVSSSVSGVAMKGDPAAAIGAVVGKAMEPLGNGEGTIMVQAMLR